MHLETIIGVELMDSNKKFIWDQVKVVGRFLFRDKNQVFTHAEHERFSKTTAKILAVKEDRLLFYTESKPLKLTDVQVKALEIIAKSKRRGITQSEVAKLLSMDPRSFFHQLKGLLEHKLINKMPVSHQRTFTYLLHLTRFAPVDEIEPDYSLNKSTAEGEEVKTLTSAATIRNRVMELLQSAPQKTLSASDIYRLVRADNKMAKIYRKNIAWLTCKGFVDCFIAEELGGVSGKILRFKKPLVEIKTKSTLSSPVDFIRRHQCLALTKNVTLERQIHDFIDVSGKTGVTLSEVMWEFGLNRKYAYRIGERLTSSKIFTNSDVVRVAEFYGKERRHRFFTSRGQSGDQTETDVQGIPTGSRDSINRTKRMRVLLEIVKEVEVIEVGKMLAAELQRRLKEQDFTMDLKTLKRLISYLEYSNDIQSIIIALPNGINRTIILKGDLSIEDEKVVGYIESMKKSKIELSSVLIDGKDQEKKLMSTEVKTEQSKNHKYQMQKQGFVHGILQRCRLLHTYLLQNVVLPRRNLEKDDNWLFETLPTLFRSLSLSLFLKLIGLAEMSSQLTIYITNLSPKDKELPLDRLSKEIRDEIHKRRVGAHKVVMKKLMELMCQLGLATVDNRYPSVAFRLPYQYRLCQFGSILDIGSGNVIRILEFTRVENIELYWNWLGSIYQLENFIPSSSLPEIYLLAMQKDNWQSIRPNRRKLRQVIREFVHERGQNETSISIDEELQELTKEHDVDKEIIMQEYHALLAEIEQRKSRRNEARALKRQKRQEDARRLILPRTINVNETEMESGESEVEAIRLRKTVLRSFSDVELNTLRLASIILHRSNFTNVLGNVQWSLLEALQKRGLLRSLRSIEETRGMLSRFSFSYDQIKLMRSLGRDMAFLKAAMDAEHINPEPTAEEDQENYFINLIAFYLDQLKKKNEIKREIREYHKKRLDDWKDMSKVISINNDVGPHDLNVQWRRMSRTQQYQLFYDLPSYVVKNFEKLARTDVEYENETIILKKALFAVPIAQYDPEMTQRYLQKLAPDRIESALERLLDSGLITNGERARFLQRIPGSEYSVHETFVGIIDGCTNWPSSNQVDVDVDHHDLIYLMRMVGAGKIDLDFEIEYDSPRILIKRGRGADLLIFDDVIDRYASSTSDYRPIWFAIEGDFKKNVVRAACRLVYYEIECLPGINQAKLIENFRPYLTHFEVEKCLEILTQSKLIENEPGTSSFFTL